MVAVVTAVLPVQTGDGQLLYELRSGPRRQPRNQESGFQLLCRVLSSETYARAAPRAAALRKTFNPGRGAAGHRWIAEVLISDIGSKVWGKTVANCQAAIMRD